LTVLSIFSAGIMQVILIIFLKTILSGSESDLKLHRYFWEDRRRLEKPRKIHVRIMGGFWFPVGPIHILDNPPQIGGSIGMHWRFLCLDLVGIFGFLKSNNSHKIEASGQIYSSKTFRSTFLGQEIALPINFDIQQIQIYGWIGYNGIQRKQFERKGCFFPVYPWNFLWRHEKRQLIQHF
jgi:hypothetical protein